MVITPTVGRQAIQAARPDLARISPSVFTNVLFYRKLRDEYDKLEGALKKLGVDPECVVATEDEEQS